MELEYDADILVLVLSLLKIRTGRMEDSLSCALEVLPE